MPLIAGRLCEYPEGKGLNLTETEKEKLNPLNYEILPVLAKRTRPTQAEIPFTGPHEMQGIFHRGLNERTRKNQINQINEIDQINQTHQTTNTIEIDETTGPNANNETMPPIHFKGENRINTFNAVIK